MIYVMSDIHGNRAKFDSIMEQIGLRAEDTLYILGDIVDRGPDPIGILRQVMSLPNVKMLLGNHEHMMLRALGDPYEASDVPNPEESLFHWYRNGGDVTHRYWKRIRKTLRAEVIAYLKSLPLTDRGSWFGSECSLSTGYAVGCGKATTRHKQIIVLFG